MLVSQNNTNRTRFMKISYKEQQQNKTLDEWLDSVTKDDGLL